jgi:hypothetical protein
MKEQHHMKNTRTTLLIVGLVSVIALGTAACGGSNSPTGVYKAYQQALRDKDAAKIRGTMSASLLKLVEENAKKKNKSLDEFLTSGLPLPPALPETRNEKIDGDKATLEVQSPNSGQWITTTFIRENGQWKYDG